jgi:hypothetical protein
LVHNGGLGMSGDGPPSTCHGVPPEDMDEWISPTPIGSGFVGIMSETGMGSGPPYTLDEVALALRQCIRSFQRTADGRAITHQNHYRSADGRQETKTCGPYTPATTRACLSRPVFPEGLLPWPARPRSPSRPGSVLPSAASASWSAATPTGGGPSVRRRWRSRPSRRGVEASAGRSLPTCGSPPRSRSRGAGSRRWVRTG